MLKFIAVLAAGLAVLPMTAAGAVAGDQNQLFVIQQSPAGTPFGNTLTIDQSDATNSLVRGLNANLIGVLPALLLTGVGIDTDFALQRGEGNRAELTLTGTNAELQLLQSSNPLAIWVPGNATGNNTATMVAATEALGGVAQVGRDNTASLDLGLNATGLVVQVGNNLTGSLEVGANGTGQILQAGINNDAGTVQVPAGSNVTVIQIGSNIAPSNSGLQVLSTSNSGNVTITQTAW